MGPGSSYFFFCLIVAGSSDGSDSSDRSILFGTKTVQHTPKIKRVDLDLAEELPPFSWSP